MLSTPPLPSRRLSRLSSNHHHLDILDDDLPLESRPPRHAPNLALSLAQADLLLLPRQREERPSPSQAGSILPPTKIPTKPTLHSSPPPLHPRRSRSNHPSSSLLLLVFRELARLSFSPPPLFTHSVSSLLFLLLLALSQTLKQRSSTSRFSDDVVDLLELYGRVQSVDVPGGKITVLWSLFAYSGNPKSTLFLPGTVKEGGFWVGYPDYPIGD